MHCSGSLTFLHLVITLTIGQCIEEGAQLSSVDVLQNGSVKYTASYDAVDLNEAAAQGMSDGEMKDLLHWAISRFPGPLLRSHSRNIKSERTISVTKRFVCRAQRPQSTAGRCVWQDPTGWR